MHWARTPLSVGTPIAARRAASPSPPVPLQDRHLWCSAPKLFPVDRRSGFLRGTSSILGALSFDPYCRRFQEPLARLIPPRRLRIALNWAPNRRSRSGTPPPRSTVLPHPPCRLLVPRTGYERVWGPPICGLPPRNFRTLSKFVSNVPPPARLHRKRTPLRYTPLVSPRLPPSPSGTRRASPTLHVSIGPLPDVSISAATWRPPKSPPNDGCERALDDALFRATTGGGLLPAWGAGVALRGGGTFEDAARVTGGWSGRLLGGRLVLIWLGRCATKKKAKMNRDI